MRLLIDAFGLRQIHGFPCFPALYNERLFDQPFIGCFVESHQPRRNAQAFLLLAHTCVLRCTVISIRTLTPCICGSRVVTTMLMEISVYPFDYKPAVAHFVDARNLQIGVGDDDNEKLCIAGTINDNCPARESDINIIPVCASIATQNPTIAPCYHRALISE